MVKEKLISKEEALMRVEPEQLDQLLHKVIDPKAQLKVIAKGLPASPGAATGQAVFDADTAAVRGGKGDKVILIRQETNPDDIHGMDAAQGILNRSRGNDLMHAVVARGMGKSCVAGCEEIRVSESAKQFSINGTTVKENEWITLDGSTGRVIMGKAPLIEPEISGEFGIFMGWVDKIRNAQSPRQCRHSKRRRLWRVAFGAEGIGLCRTEHMFFAEDRLPFMQEMIVATDLEARKRALAKLLPFQKEDFKGLFREMKGYGVTIRTIDPPLHEFLPKTREDAEVLSKKIGVSTDKIMQAAEELHEFNPMLGHRGCRLGITYPEITEMQVKAIISAACELATEKIKVIPEIMIPLVGNVLELRDQKEIAVRVAEATMKEYGVKIQYQIGTMIEVPRGALTADEIGCSKPISSASERMT